MSAPVQAVHHPIRRGMMRARTSINGRNPKVGDNNMMGMLHLIISLLVDVLIVDAIPQNIRERIINYS